MPLASGCQSARGLAASCSVNFWERFGLLLNALFSGPVHLMQYHFSVYVFDDFLDTAIVVDFLL